MHPDFPKESGSCRTGRSTLGFDLGLTIIAFTGVLKAALQRALEVLDRDVDEAHRAIREAQTEYLAASRRLSVAVQRSNKVKAERNSIARLLEKGERL